MPINLPEGFLDAARWAELGELSEAALRHMIEGGEVLELEGSALTTDQAVDALREFLGRKGAKQGITCLGCEARHVKEEGVIEPEIFSRARVLSHRGPDLPRRQLPLVAPIEVDVGALAMRFDLGAFLGLKRSLPRQADSVGVVAQIEHTLVRKLLDHSGV